MQPWCPFAVKKPSPNFTAGRSAPVKANVLHIAQGGATGSLDWLTNPKSEVSSHFFITKAGQIFQLVAITDTAWANGLRWSGQWLTPSRKPVKPRWTGLIPGKNPNGYTISIEHEGKTGEPLTLAMEDAQIRLLVWLKEQCDWDAYRKGENLIGHGDINPVDKSFCPGSAFDLNLIALRANNASQPTQPGNVLLTERSTLFGPTLANKDKILTLILRRGSKRSAADIRDILDAIFAIAITAGIPAEIVVAQQIIETSAQADADPELEPFSSFWSQDPRNNLSGIGVTGVPGAGVLFPSLLDAVQAEIGRLLRYFLKPGVGTEAQQMLMSTALYWRKLDEDLWGSCTQLAHLGAVRNPTGKGWAYPGPAYGQHIASVANMLRGL